MDNATAKIIAVTGKEFASAKVTIQFLSVDGDLRETQISTAMAGLMTQHLLNDAQMMIHPLARAFKLIDGCQNIHQLKALSNAVMEPGKGCLFQQKRINGRSCVIKQVILCTLTAITLTGCVSTYQPTNLERGYNQPCYATDGRWYYGDPFAPVSNDQACIAHGKTPMFAQ